MLSNQGERDSGLHGCSVGIGQPLIRWLRERGSKPCWLQQCSCWYKSAVDVHMVPLVQGTSVLAAPNTSLAPAALPLILLRMAFVLGSNVGLEVVQDAVCLCI